MINFKLPKSILFIFLVFLILQGCAGKKKEDQEIANILKKSNEPPKDLKERVQESKSGIIFNRDKGEAQAAFASNNILWRATLKSLDFVPLNSADYAGGVIVTDWYSPSLNSSSSIKITVNFLSNALSSSSIEVNGYEKLCDKSSFNCSTKKTSADFNSKIKNKILSTARDLSISQKKN